MSSSKNTENNVGDVKHYGSRFHVSCRPQLLILYVVEFDEGIDSVWFYCIIFTTL